MPIFIFRNEENAAFAKIAELHDLVKMGLTHLVSANSESGFKQCLPLAYDQDSRKRTIFAHVFARVNGQGAALNPKDKSILKARFQALYEHVRGPDVSGLTHGIFLNLDFLFS